MAWRFRADLTFARNTGLGEWCDDQIAQRMGMAFHMREGTPAEERSRHALTRQGNRDRHTCDVFFPDEALAVDTWETLLSVAPQAVQVDREDPSTSPSWMDVHECRHGWSVELDRRCPPDRRWDR